MIMRNRILGIAFVAVLVAALSLSVLQYRKAFSPVAWVTLYTEHTGMQLSRGAEVKLRGVVVGEVRTISSDGDRARLRLALDPALISQIPADVSARLLPKTLFGERYVALVPPSGDAGRSIRPGAVINQDRSQSGVELERVLDDALPLLQSIEPEKLAATLGALAAALDGRGDKLGRDLVTLDGYLDELNKEMPAIADDVRKLAEVLDVYDGALPDLLSILRDVTVTAHTVVDQQAELAAFLDDATDAGDVGRIFLQRHGDQLVQVGSVSRPLLELLATYAPEYPCVMRGVVALQPRVEQVFRNGQMHITLEITRDNGKYDAGRDAPVYGAKNGPNCRGLPHPAVPAPEVPISDGYDYNGKRPVADKLPVGIPSSGKAAAPPKTPTPADMGYAGTSEEQDLLKPIIGAATGALPVQVPDIAVLLWGPLLRGAVVNTK